MIEEFKKYLLDNFNKIDNLDDKLKKLNDYYLFLIDYNKKINLTRITGEEDVYYKHFLDSLIPFKNITLDNKNLFDIGSGAGFPGVVLAIFNPLLKVVLCESINKKAVFLDNLIRYLKLENAMVYTGRAEDYYKISNNKFDYITARAVSSIDNLLKYSVNLVDNNSKVILYKGLNYQDELKEVKSKKFNLKKKIEFNLPKEYGSRVCLVYTLR